MKQCVHCKNQTEYAFDLSGSEEIWVCHKCKTEYCYDVDTQEFDELED